MKRAYTPPEVEIFSLNDDPLALGGSSNPQFPTDEDGYIIGAY